MDNEQVEAVTKNLVDKLLQIKQTILDLLAILELQEEVPWSDMSQMFCSLSSQFSTLQTMLKTSRVSGTEDCEQLLKSHLVVPLTVENFANPLVQVISFNF